MKKKGSLIWLKLQSLSSYEIIFFLQFEFGHETFLWVLKFILSLKYLVQNPIGSRSFFMMPDPTDLHKISTIQTARAEFWFKERRHTPHPLKYRIYTYN